jgi:hypothetical protein
VGAACSPTTAPWSRDHAPDYAPVAERLCIAEEVLVCVPIQWVSRDANGTITHVGGSSQRGVVWGLSAAEATSLAKQQLWEFFVDVAGNRVRVLVANRGGSEFLTTSPDGISANNLDNLPMNPQPVTGVLPEFPLSLPGVEAMRLMRVQSVKYAAGGQLRPLISQVLDPTSGTTRMTPPASFWTQNPRWLYFDVLVPFPCEVMVFQAFVLTRVPGDSPAARRALEDAGKGWWSIDYVLTRADGTIDPTKPTRITEARIIVRPSQSDWAAGRAYVGLSCHSLNTNCAYTGVSGTFIDISLTKPTAPVPPPTPMVTVPNVVGQRLDLALKTLWALKFKVTSVGPVDMSTNLQVVSQDLTAGTTVKEGAGILISTRQIAAAPGVKSLAISNQSNRAAPLDVWLFDYTQGSWSKETTVAYQATGNVSFEDGHLYWISAVDTTTPLCDSGQPEEPACVYATPARNYEGDDSGLALAWTVT